MVILDTNIVSEMMRPLPNPGVVAWLNRQDRERVFSTVVTVAEINLGLALMPAGKRRDELRSKAYLVFSEKLA
jgi:predicted nucleic acid-binding protein